MSEKKSILKFMTCGSVDDGKSTLLGRILFDAKKIFDDQISQLYLNKPNNKDQEIDFSLLLDGLSSEREQGITIDVAYRFFNTDKRKFIIADTPGHFQYTRNMVTAASSSELAIILVDAKKGISKQTKRHTFICNLLGIKGFILTINKMDLVDFSQQKFNSIFNQYKIFSKQLGIDSFKAIPVSAKHGDNLTTRSSRMKWYKGLTLLEELENYDLNNSINKNRDFVMPIQMVSKSKENKRTFFGKVIQGHVTEKDKVKILPSNVLTTISKIMSPTDKTKAYLNESIKVNFSDEVDCSRGDVICSKNSNVKIADQFEVTLIWMDNSHLISGRQYWIKIGTKVILGRIQEVKNKIDIEDFKLLSTKKLSLNDIGKCILITNETIPYIPYEYNRELGSFILIDKETNNTVGAGLINFALRRSENLFYHKITVDQKQRSKIKNQKPFVIWMTGLSGSGKSTIANCIEKKLIFKSFHTYILDGDNIRLGLNKDLGFTISDRAENIRRISEVAKLMNEAGLIVITAFISPFKNERSLAKNIIGEDKFIEVFIDTPISIAEKRDVKGLYKKARQGDLKNFTGIDSPYQKPKSPQIHIETTKNSAENAADIIIDYLFKKIKKFN